MKILRDEIWPGAIGICIAIPALMAFGVDPTFGVFAEREDRKFPICRRDLFVEMDDDFEWRQTIEPVQSYEVVCGYRDGIGGEYGSIVEQLRVFEDGRLVSTDTKIPGAFYTVECVRYSTPPPKHHSYDWLTIEDDLFCKMPRLGIAPPRD